MELQLVGHDRQHVCLGADGGKKGVGPAEADLKIGAGVGVSVGASVRQVRMVLFRQRQHVFDLRLGRAAAVVAHAKEAHGGVEFGGLGGHGLQDVLLLVDVPGRVGAGDAEGEDAAAVGRLPPEDAGRQLLFVRAGAHKDVGVKAAPAQDLRERAGMAKGVDAVGDGGFDAQVGAHVALAEQHLAHKRLAGGEVHVGLDDHAVDHVPAAGGDRLLDLRKEGGVLRLDPGVDLRLAACEVKVRVFGQPVDGRLAGAERLGAAFGPAPEPDGVEMGLADHVNSDLVHGINQPFKPVRVMTTP